jgi:Bacterial Ig-like domain
MSISFFRPWPAGFFPRRAGLTARRRARSFRVGATEGLEERLVMSAASSIPAIQMLSATTTDSKSVTIQYRINQAPTAADPVQLGIYRSSNGQFNTSDSLVGTVTLAAPGSASGQGAITVDQSGQPATAVGTHELTIPLAQGLPPFPAKPYVLVVADPGSPSAMTEPDQAASFRVYTIGIVTHGGIEDPSWTHGPPWELETAYMMRHEGFDAVIAYNWVLQSSTPGAAIQQSPRLARMIMDVASKFPPSDPVDLEFIGHSEGTVINTYAIVKLEGEMTPQLKSGYVEDILLDPHAANNNVPGQQMSFGGALGGIAHVIVSDYQAEANDPPAFIPPVVDAADVFFQHSQATPDAIYNLWGQVPVKSDGALVHYYNLTAMGATHSGKTGVNYWFANFIAPTLGDQAPLVEELQLNGQIDNAVSPAAALASASASTSTSQSNLLQQAGSARADRIYGPAQVVESDVPEFSGTAAPGSLIRLALSPAAKPMKLTLAGATTASSTGQWSVTPTHALKDGQYRTLVTAFSPALTTRPAYAMVPTQPLGRLVVDAPGGS